MGHASKTVDRARAEVEKLFAKPASTVRQLWAYIGELNIPQKLDRDGRPVPGVWVLPGRSVVTTEELYLVAKKRGETLVFSNAKQGA